MDLEGLQECRKQTKQNILKLLETNNRVGCVRWTGFGKSHMINELYEELPGKKLILTSTTALRDEFNSSNCECITYELLNCRIENNKFLNKYNNIDYLFLDECHRVSPTNQWGYSLEKFINKLNCKVLGFTATPNRTDKINVIQYWFNNIQVFPMYIDDAYNLRYINSIIYVKSYFNIEEIKTKIKTVVEANNYNISEVNLDNIIGIKEIIEKYYNQELNGNKIIVFCKRVNDLEEVKDYYYKIFKDLFPKEIINTYITSHKDLLNKQLDKFKDQNKGINIMFTVDKLGEGIHIEKVNTIIFMRPTISEVKYFQQLGRGINGKQQSLIFDFANNCNRVIKNDERGNPRLKSNRKHKSKNGQLDKLMDLIEVKDYTIEINKIFDRINNKVTKEQKRYLKENALNKTVPELSIDTGLSKEYIYGFFSKNNIEHKKTENIIDYTYIDDHYKDETVSELSEHTGICKDTIWGYLNRTGKKDYKRMRHDYTYIDDHYKDETVSELSEHTGILESSIKYYYYKNGIKDYKRNRDYTYIDDHYKEETFLELSKHTGFSVSTIQHYCKRKGYKKNRKRRKRGR